MPAHGDGTNGMARLLNCARRFLLADDGPTAIEYAFLLALISLFCVVGIRMLGTRTEAPFTKAAGAIGTASGRKESRPTSPKQTHRTPAGPTAKQPAAP
jgi:pilus assembly protein Flp/PilA